MRLKIKSAEVVTRKVKGVTERTRGKEFTFREQAAVVALGRRFVSLL